MATQLYSSICLEDSSTNCKNYEIKVHLSTEKHYSVKTLVSGNNNEVFSKWVSENLSCANKESSQSKKKIKKIIKPKIVTVSVQYDSTSKKKKKLASIIIQHKDSAFFLHVLKDGGMDDLPQFLVDFLSSPSYNFTYVGSPDFDDFLKILKSAYKFKLENFHERKPKLGHLSDIETLMGEVQTKIDKMSNHWGASVLPENHVLLGSLKSLLAWISSY